MLEQYPMAWLVDVGGFIVDARMLPADMKDEAHGPGLIPDLDAVRAACPPPPIPPRSSRISPLTSTRRRAPRTAAPACYCSTARRAEVRRGLRVIQAPG
jgi:hypothetical protein